MQPAQAHAVPRAPHVSTAFADPCSTPYTRWRLVGVLGEVASFQIVHQSAANNEQQPKRMAFCTLRKPTVDRRCRGQTFSGPKNNRPADERESSAPPARRLDARFDASDAPQQCFMAALFWRLTTTKIICPNVSMQFHPNELYRASVIRNARREHRPKASARVHTPVRECNKERA